MNTTGELLHDFQWVIIPHGTVGDMVRLNIRVVPMITSTSAGFEVKSLRQISGRLGALDRAGQLAIMNWPRFLREKRPCLFLTGAGEACLRIDLFQAWEHAQ